jgi:hypothetical protein
LSPSRDKRATMSPPRRPGWNHPVSLKTGERLSPPRRTAIPDVFTTRFAVNDLQRLDQFGARSRNRGNRIEAPHGEHLLAVEAHTQRFAGILHLSATKIGSVDPGSRRWLLHSVGDASSMRRRSSPL